MPVVFAELFGATGVTNFHQTYDLIESLNPATVISSHGTLFTNLIQALSVSSKKQ
jgi:hypothetical protein